MVKDLTAQQFGYRDRSKGAGTPLTPVEVLKMGPKPSSRQVRVRWLAGEWEGRAGGMGPTAAVGRALGRGAGLSSG